MAIWGGELSIEGEGSPNLRHTMLGRGLQETIVSGKAVPEVLNMKYRLEFKHGFTNRGCLQWLF